MNPLPIIEKWDCHGCGQCCYGSTITLDAEDLAKLREQQWEKKREFRSTQIVKREALLGGKRVLAKKPDGSCVFLTDENRCRIHEMHGEGAKPAICRLFPFQLVQLDRVAYITPRRSCPSAAADLGRTVKQHLTSLKRSGLLKPAKGAEAPPPRIVKRRQLAWPEFVIITDALAHLVTDEDYPMVRRLIHGLQFCTLLEYKRHWNIDENSLREFVSQAETLAVGGAGNYFRDRQPPSRGSIALLRQIGMHYIRSHPGFHKAESWRQRLYLMWVSTRFARGKGRVPPIHPAFPSVSFAQLEQPIGQLPRELLHPLERYFETHALSRQYILADRRRSTVQSFRGLALSFSIALWLLRSTAANRTPSHDDVIGIVTALERGRGMSGLPRVASTLASTGQLERVVAWYAQ